MLFAKGWLRSNIAVTGSGGATTGVGPALPAGMDTLGALELLGNCAISLFLQAMKRLARKSEKTIRGVLLKFIRLN